MASNQPKGYTIKDFTLELDPATSPGKFQDARKRESGNNSNLDIQRICSGFNYIESIDAASVRCEFIINDSIDLIDSLTGNEKITIELETDSAPGTTLKIEQQIFKIGNIIKQEKSQVYVIYTVSPFIIAGETKKVFKAFQGKPASDIVKDMCNDYLGAKNAKIEGTQGNFNFIAPHWRALDVINYITDKCVSADTKTSGFRFFEDKDSVRFATIDSLCKVDGKPVKYTFEQANVGESDKNAFKIESVKFPDRANHLEKMRTGAYSNTVIGVKVPAMTGGMLPSADKTTGSIHKPINMGLTTVFGLAKSRGCILNDTFPFPKVNKEYFSDKNPTRVKIRALPGMKDSKTMQNSDAAAANMDFDTVRSSAYSFSRWQLLNAITLDIQVPGNVNLTVGQVIDVEIPKSSQSSSRAEVDEIYSGNYLIKGLRHNYAPDGITTYLNLAKDSIAMQ